MEHVVIHHFTKRDTSLRRVTFGKTGFCKLCVITTERTLIEWFELEYNSRAFQSGIIIS